MTRDTTDTEESTAHGANRMGDVDHTHPHRNTTFGSIFGRGPSVAADGGESAPGRRASSEERSESDGGEPAAGGRSPSGRGSDGGAPATQADTGMADVDHESPTRTDASRVFARGDEATDRGATEGPVADE